MNIIKSYKPINTRDKVDQLINELKKHPDAMNSVVRQEICMSINKLPIQKYFQEKYPEALFTEVPCEIDLPQSTLGSKKYIVGTYLEMAFHNFFLNMERIYAIVFGKSIIEEAHDSFKTENPGKVWNEDFGNKQYVWQPIFSQMRDCLPEERLKVDEQLGKSFPFLDIAYEYTKASENYSNIDRIDILEFFSQQLRILRHYYSHYRITLYDTQVDTYKENESLIAGVLKLIFLASKRVVKSRFALEDKDMKCAEQFEFRTKFQNGKPNKEKKEVKGFRYRITGKDDIHLSEFGLVLLCSLFIEKKYSQILTEKLHCIPTADKPVMTELIAVYRIRLHNERFFVDKSTDALALDILTELRRCPKELFDIISPKDQGKFRVKEEGDEDNGTLMVRRQDHFTNFVLKYIDKAKLFDSIRFQVSLGNYFFKFYDKYCIDNSATPRVRSLSKRVNGFGRIDEIDVAREEVWGTSIRAYEDVHRNTKDEQPYVTDHHARYIVNGNRIAMRIFDDSLRMHIPELTPLGVSNLAPTCWLSIYELPAMAFLIHLRGGTFVEEIIKSTVNNYKKLFRDVAEGKLVPVSSEKELAEILDNKYGHIRHSDIPHDIKDYLTGRNADTNKLFKVQTENLIHTLIEQTEYKKKRFLDDKKKIKEKQNKVGKKNYITIKPGKLASFMAKDIMFFQPNDKENKNRLTSLNFRILQSMLALYSDADELKRALTSAHIIGEKNGMMCNPIMMRVFSKDKIPTNIEELYTEYLNERLEYLKRCKTIDPVSLPFTHPDRIRWQEHDEDFYKAKAERYLSNGTNDSALELPRGLFERYIRTELQDMREMEVIANDATKNVSFLIYGYYKNIMSDDCQPMYEYGRTYPLLNILYREEPTSPKIYYGINKIREALMSGNKNSFRKGIQTHISAIKPHLRKDESDRMAGLLRQVKDNETLLKRYRIQDMILLLIAKKLLMTEEKDNERIVAVEKIKLKNVTDQSVLGLKRDFSTTIMSKKGYRKTIKQKDLKIKDYAKFYRILSDRRLPSLLDLVIKNVIDKSMIEEELSGYDKVHPDILEHVFKYEKNNTGSKFSEIVRNDDRLSSFDTGVLIETRNSFAHSSYPPYYALKEEARNKELPEKAIKISETFKKLIVN